MTTDATPALLERLDAVERRLRAHAERTLSGLTAPDAKTGEQWEAGQVWAHLAEFPAYWVEQFDRVLTAHREGASEPVPFGRTITDPGRLAAIERDRSTDPHALLQRVSAGVASARAQLASLTDDSWRARGAHPVRGEMTLEQMYERFIVGHLEEHAEQLDSLEDAPAR